MTFKPQGYYLHVPTGQKIHNSNYAWGPLPDGWVEISEVYFWVSQPNHFEALRREAQAVWS